MTTEVVEPGEDYVVGIARNAAMAAKQYKKQTVGDCAIHVGLSDPKENPAMAGKALGA